VFPLLQLDSWLTGRRAVCLPFSDFCEPIGNTAEIREGMVQYALSLRGANRWKHIELRSSMNDHAFHKSATYKRHRLKLNAEPELVRRGFGKGNRYSISRAEKLGVVTERRTDDEAMEAFIRLNHRTRKKHGMPPQPDAFFWLLLDNVIRNNMGFIGVGLVEREIVAASVYLHFGKTVYHKYSASDERRLMFQMNHAVMWDAIKWACLQGYTTFDLGRSEVGGEGLLQYKRSWGSEETALSYYRFTGHDGREESGDGGIVERLGPVMKHFPILLLKFLGSHLYRHVG
jgi:hypothetical protein